LYHFSNIDYNIIQIFAPTATFRRYKLPLTSIVSSDKNPLYCAFLLLNIDVIVRNASSL